MLFPQPLAGVSAPIAGYFEDAFGTRDWQLAPFSDHPDESALTLPHPVVNALPVTKSAGSWDDDVCCSTVVDRPGRRLLWYSGRTSGDAVWRIGLAESDDGGAHFSRVGDGPVLTEGGRDAYDSRGASMPTVLWDETRQLYRMWYTATGPFGVTSIAYAVSTDGVTWHKLPGNPVVKATDVGLESIGRPAIIDDQGRTRMWVHGADPMQNGTRIYALENDGQPPQ